MDGTATISCITHTFWETRNLERTVTLSPGDSLQFQNEPLPDVVKLVGKDCVIDDIFIGKGGDVFLDLTHVDGRVIIPYRNVISLVEQGHATVLNN